MTDLFSLAALLWPALLVIGLFPVVLLVLGHAGFGRRAAIASAFGVLVALGLLYTVPVVRNPIRWGLTILGFAAPMALGVISIRYVVEET